MSSQPYRLPISDPEVSSSSCNSPATKRKRYDRGQCYVERCPIGGSMLEQVTTKNAKITRKIRSGNHHDRPRSTRIKKGSLHGILHTSSFLPGSNFTDEVLRSCQTSSGVSYHEGGELQTKRATVQSTCSDNGVCRAQSRDYERLRMLCKSPGTSIVNPHCQGQGQVNPRLSDNNNDNIFQSAAIKRNAGRTKDLAKTAFDQYTPKTTPLITAIMTGNVARVRQLLEAGANVNDQQPQDKATPLHVAVNYCDKMDLPIADILCKFGADPMLRNEDGQSVLETVFWLARREDHVTSVWQQSLRVKKAKKLEDTDPLWVEFVEDVLNSLLQAPPTYCVQQWTRVLGDIVHSDTWSDLSPLRLDCPYTPLMWTARAGAIQVIRTLLSKGTDVNAISPDGKTALSESAFIGEAVIVRLLIAHGARVNISSIAGMTTMKASLGIMESPPTHISLADMKRHDREEVISLCVKNGGSEILRSLDMRSVNEIYRQVMFCSPGILHQLLEGGLNPGLLSLDTEDFSILTSTKFKLLLNYGLLPKSLGRKVWHLTPMPCTEPSNISPAVVECILHAGFDLHIRPGCFTNQVEVERQLSGFWNTVQPLSQLCRTSLRDHLSPFHVQKLSRLNLPRAFNRFVLLHDIADA